MDVADLWTWEMVIAAFAGGAFGASIGALQSFSLAGLMIVFGEVYALAYRGSGDLAPIDVTGSIGFGVVLGPHIAFAGGAAAIAFAAKVGHFDADFAYHDAKHITHGLGANPVSLVVGGVFGMVGYWVATLALVLGVPTDPIALGVVASAVIHRLAFGYSLIGAAPHGLLDMSPFERGQRRSSADVVVDGGRRRLLVEPWLPYQYRWSTVALLGAVVGILGAYLTYLTGSAFLSFGLTAFSLAFLCAGVANIPVTHHMALPASTIVLASVDPYSTQAGQLAAAISLGEALLFGAAFGLVGGLIGELAQRVFYAHADTHLDPPAVSIVVTTLFIGALALLGYLPHSAWIPLPW